MNEVIMNNISFHYPESANYVIEDLSLSLPRGVVSLVGQNGSGKTTILLLAAGILLPTSGRVYLQGLDTADLRVESERQRFVSFIYQNMEFETGESIGDLLEYVYENGFHEKKDVDFIPTLIRICELESVLHKKTQEVSKGELQRAIIAFSLLYGSRILMMDEPIFALEDYQKRRVMDFLVEYVRERDISLYYSVHELNISERYSDYLLITSRKALPKLGSTGEMFSKQKIEEAYGVPFDLLKKKEALYRQILFKIKQNGNN